jgi:cell division protein FtsA
MEVIVGLDIGTTKVCVIVGEVEISGGINIVGVGSSPSTGLHKGIIVDADKVVDAICEAKAQAELECGFKIKRAYVGIAGGHLCSLNSRGAIQVYNSDFGITDEDVEQVLASAKAVKLPDGAEIIHVFAREFIIDGHGGIKRPVGMYGNQLEVEAHVVIASVMAIQNIIRCTNRAGIQVEDVVLQPIASSEVVLSPSEKELGVILVDIGGGTTDVAVFDEGTIWHTTVIPVGGRHITSDIAHGLRSSLACAEDVKLKHGSAVPEAVEDDQIEVMDIREKDTILVSRRFLCQIIEARLQEIMTLVGEDIVRSQYRNAMPSGLVLTGGSSMLHGLTLLASKVTGYPARVGLPEGFGEDREIIRNPIYATGVGLLQYGAKRYVKKAGERPQRISIDSIVRMVKGWFKEFF